MTGQHDAPATQTDPAFRRDGTVNSSIGSGPHPALKHLPNSLGIAFGCAVLVGLLGRLFNGEWQSMPAFLSTFLLIAAGCIPFTEWESESKSSKNGAGLGVMLGVAVGVAYGLMVSRFFEGVFFIGCIGTGVGWLMARYGVTHVPLPYTRDATMRTAAAISAAVLILHVTGILSSGGDKDLLPQSEVIATAKVNDTPGGEGQTSGKGPLEPHDIEVYCGLTQEAVKAKEWAMAIRFINEAIGRTPNNFKLHTTRAYAFKAHGLDTKERELLTKAEGDLTSAIRIGSDNKQSLAEAYYERGCIRTDLLGEHTSAIDDFQKAHAAAPGHTPTAEGLARAKAALGRQQSPDATAAASVSSGAKTEPSTKTTTTVSAREESSSDEPRYILKRGLFGGTVTIITGGDVGHNLELSGLKWDGPSIKMRVKWIRGERPPWRYNITAYDGDNEVVQTTFLSCPFIKEGRVGGTYMAEIYLGDDAARTVKVIRVHM